MKKVFLASTAIVGLLSLGAPAEAAQPITVTLGGYLAAQAGLWENNRPAQLGYELRDDLELHVDASAEADNGLKYGVAIQIEYVTGNGRTLRTDEANIFLSGKFGTVEIGDQDGASDSLAVYGPFVGVGSDILDGDYSFFIADVFPNGGTAQSGNSPFKAADSEDSTKVTYFTPSLAGFKAGISFAPQANEGDSVVQSDATNATRDYIEMGAQYQREFNGVGVLLGVTASNYTVKGRPAQDYWGVQVGAQISYQGFTIGGGYLDQDGAARTVDKYQSWNIGASYTTGPVVVAVGYQNADTDLVGNRDFESYGGGVTYTVADGLSVYGEIVHYDDTTTTRDDGTIAILGTTVSF